MSLGGLQPEDVAVELRQGPVDEHDRIIDSVALPLTPAEAYEEGRWRYEGTLALEKAGSFGYTVRVLPSHSQLASEAEMNLVAEPQERPQAMDTALR